MRVAMVWFLGFVSNAGFCGSVGYFYNNTTDDLEVSIDGLGYIVRSQEQTRDVQQSEDPLSGFQQQLSVALKPSTGCYLEFLRAISGGKLPKYEVKKAGKLETNVASVSSAPLSWQVTPEFNLMQGGVNDKTQQLLLNSICTEKRKEFFLKAYTATFCIIINNK